MKLSAFLFCFEKSRLDAKCPIENTKIVSSIRREQEMYAENQSINQSIDQSINPDFES